MTLTIDNSGDWSVVDATLTVTLQRETTTKDGSGGPLQAWANQTTCTGDLQPASGAVVERFAQKGLDVKYTLFLSADVGALASDRFVIGTDIYGIVEGGYEAGFAPLTGWPGTAHVNKIPGGT